MVSGAGFNNTGGPLQFNHPSGVATDGERFLLCDRFNNRVLVWTSPPDRWDAPPALVLGQPDFTSNDPGTTKSSLNWPGNVSTARGIVAVADTENDRLLVWRRPLASNAQAADVAIDLRRLTRAGASQPYGWPWGVWTDGTRLAAVATFGGALLFWDSLPASDDQPPDYTVSLPEFGTPRNISTDGKRYLFVGDHNQRVTGSGPGTFFWNAFPTRADARFDFFRPEWIKGAGLADGTLIAGGLSSIYVWDAFPTASSHHPRLTLVPEGRIYQNGDGPDVTVAGGRIYINNYNGNNVLVYDRVPTDAAERPAFALGSPDPATNTLSAINYIQNPVVASDGTRLIATSDFDGALWIWSTLPASGAAPAVRIDLRASRLAPWDNALSAGRLVVGGNESVGIWDALPLAGQAPARVFSRNIGRAPLRAVTGIALDASNFYVATSDGTMHVWRGLPVTGLEDPFLTMQLPKADVTNLHSDGTHLCVTARANPPAVYVYRVSDFAAGSPPAPYRTVASSAQVPLNLPGGAITFGNSLAIANTSNNQVLLWERLDDAGSAASATVLGQGSLQETAAAIGADRLFMPASLAYVDGTLWVGEFKFSSRILKFSVTRPSSPP